jgi:hypothetical protein
MYSLMYRAHVTIESDQDYTLARKLGAQYGSVDFAASDQHGESRIVESFQPIKVNTWDK